VPADRFAVRAPSRIGHRERAVPERPAPALVDIDHPFRESDYTQVLLGCIGLAIDSERAAIRAKARAHVNAKAGRPGLPVVPQTHDWAKLEDRLLFLRYYVEDLHQFGGEGPAPTREQLTLGIANAEIEWERTNGTHYAAYQDMTARWYGPKFRAPDPLPPAPTPRLDPETQEIIDRNQVVEKLQAYLASVSKGRAVAEKAYGELLVAQANVLSEFGVRLRLEFDDQKQRADDHPVIEWLMAHDFPVQNGNLLSVLFDLLNQVRSFAKAGDIDTALRQLESAETLHDRLAKLLEEYYADKVAYAKRILFVLHTLKAISRMLVSIVVFKNVKGVVSQFAALMAVNVAFQQFDRGIGVRSQGLSGKDAAVDAALELLMVKTAGKISQVLATRFAIDPRSITGHTMNMLVVGVIGSLEEEMMNLGQGVSFVSFLRRLRDRMSDPGFWIENIVVAYLAPKYRQKGSVSLPFGKKTAGAAVVASALLAAPRPAQASARTPMVEAPAKPTSANRASSNAPESRPGTTRPTAAAASSTHRSTGPGTQSLAPGAPTEAQRSVDRSSLSPRKQAPGPDGPGGPTKGAGAVAGVALTSRQRKRAKLLLRIRGIRKLLDRIDDPTVKQEQADKLKAVQKELATSTAFDAIEGRLQAIENKVNETFAEEQIAFFVEYMPETFDIRKVHKRVVVPSRGKGPDIIDIVFEVTTTAGKRAYLVIEAKYGSSRLGWVKLGKKLVVRQFSPEWFDMRIKEIRKQDPVFADKLEQSWKKGQILPFVIKIVEDGTPGRFVDFKEKWTDYRDKRP
jgi:hypothetical protein